MVDSQNAIKWWHSCFFWRAFSAEKDAVIAGSSSAGLYSPPETWAETSNRAGRFLAVERSNSQLSRAAIREPAVHHRETSQLVLAEQENSRGMT